MRPRPLAGVVALAIAEMALVGVATVAVVPRVAMAVRVTAVETVAAASVTVSAQPTKTVVHAWAIPPSAPNAMPWNMPSWP